MQATATEELVQRLLTHEATERQDNASPQEIAEIVLEKLRAHLSGRIGTEGVRSLLNRAQALTAAEESDTKNTAALIAHLLQLLDTLIGEGLTLRMIRAIWPQATIDNAPDAG